MSMWLRQSTASQEILLGPFVDSTDGNTAMTALTIANTDITLWKDGATTLASKNSGGATHISNGYYYAVLDATDTNTLGKLEVNVKVSGALAVRREFMVLPAMIYDSLVLGTDRFDVNVTHIADTAQTARDIGASVLLSSGTGTGQIKLAGGYVSPNWSDISNPTAAVSLTGTTIASTQTVVLGNTDHGGTSATLRLGGSTSLPALYVTNSGGDAVGFKSSFSGGNGILLQGLGAGSGLVAVGGATGSDILADITGNLSGSIGSLAAQAKADVNAEADTALSDVYLDQLLRNAVSTVFDNTVAPDSVIGYLAHNGVGTGTTSGYNRVQHSLEVIGDAAADLQARTPAALVAGRVDASVGAMQTGVLTTASIADDAITDAKIAVPAETAGRPTRVLGMLRRLWEWAGNKRTRNRTTGVVSLRNHADDADLESQTQSTASSVDTQTEGS